MPSINLDSQQEIAAFILESLPGHRQFALATVDPEKNPWAVCLGLSYTKDMDIVWASRKDTLHSRYVKENPQVSICIFSETESRGDFGFYSVGIAHEVTQEDELTGLLTVRFTDKGKAAPPVQDFLGDSPMRIYAAKLSQAWVNDDRHTKTEVNLATLRAAAKNQ